ncbi:0 [Sphingobium amiense]|uniref:Uncharacterized protein n=1 Tax=Sphingobium amiense TaxID=135719 RepID=A0A494WAE9_9SPHN|nr:0 [Sphingobium amiense] [Sphingobium amiense]
MASGQFMAGKRHIIQREFLRDARVAYRFGRKACDETRYLVQYLHDLPHDTPFPCGTARGEARRNGPRAQAGTAWARGPFFFMLYLAQAQWTGSPRDPVHPI